MSRTLSITSPDEVAERVELPTPRSKMSYGSEKGDMAQEAGEAPSRDQDVGTSTEIREEESNNEMS